MLDLNTKGVLISYLSTYMHNASKQYFINELHHIFCLVDK